MSDSNVNLTTTLACIICGSHLNDAGSGVANQPSGGTSFHSHGHYGSTVWDPMGDRVHIELNICDPCLLELANKGLVYKARAYRSVEWDYSVWDGISE